MDINLDDNIELVLDDTQTTPEESSDARDVSSQNETDVFDIEEGYLDIDENKNTDENKSPDTENLEKSPSDSESSSVFGVMAQALAEEGVISLEFEKESIKSPKDIIELINKEVDKRIKESIPEPFKDLLEIKDQVANLDPIVEVRKTINYLNELTENNIEETQAESVIKLYLQARGFEETEIEEEINEAKSLGKLEEKARALLPKIINAYNEYEKDLIQKQKEEKEAALRAEKEYVENVNKKLESIKEFDDVEISNELRKKALEALYKPKHKLPDGNLVPDIIKARMDDPIDFDTRFALVFALTKGFKDFSAFKSAGKRRTTKELEQAVKVNDFNKFGGKTIIENLGAEILNYIKL